MKIIILKIKLCIFILLASIITFTSVVNAEYPNTSIAIIDINLILSEAKAAKKVSEEIEKIAIATEEELRVSDEEMIQEQNKLIESQSIMAPEAFEAKKEEYEKKVQNYNIDRQNKLIKIDNLIAESRNQVLESLRPILEEIANDRGITIILEKNTVLLNAENMDITEEVLKSLNRALPKIEISED